MKKITTTHPNIFEQFKAFLLEILTARASYYQKQHQDFKE